MSHELSALLLTTTIQHSLAHNKPAFVLLLDAESVFDLVLRQFLVRRLFLDTRPKDPVLKHFSPSHNGDCELCGQELEDLSHLLVPRCPHLLERKALLIEYAKTVLSSSEVCLSIFSNILDNGNEDEQVQLFLDCSAIPCVISANQDDSTVIPLLFRVRRTWCYSLHRTRLKLLNRWTQ